MPFVELCLRKGSVMLAQVILSEPVNLAIVAAMTSLVTLAITKGVDAVIRWRRSEGQMEGESEDKLVARILHLEGEVARLQSELAALQYKLGRSDAHIEILQGRCDKASLPQAERLS